MNFCLKCFLLQDAFMNQAQYLGLYYDQRLRDIAFIFLLIQSGRLIGHPYCGILEGTFRALFSMCPKMGRGLGSSSCENEKIVGNLGVPFRFPKKGFPNFSPVPGSLAVFNGFQYLQYGKQPKNIKLIFKRGSAKVGGGVHKHTLPP